MDSSKSSKFASRPPPTEPKAMTRKGMKRSRGGDASPEFDNDSDNEHQRKKMSFSPENSVVYDTYRPTRDNAPKKVGRHMVTTSQVGPPGELKIRGISVPPPFEPMSKRDDEDGGPLHALPRPLRSALECLESELENLDQFFYYKSRLDAIRCMGKVHEQLDEMANASRKLYAAYCDQQGENDDLRVDIDQLKNQTKSAVQDMSLLRGRLDELQSALADSEKAKSVLEKSVDDLRTKMSNLRRDTTCQIDKLKLEKAGVVRERDEARREKDKINCESDDLRRRRDEASRVIDELNSEIDRARSENEILRRERVEAICKNEGLRQEKDEASRHRDKARSEVVEARNETMGMRRERDELKRENEDLRMSKAKLKRCETEIEELRRERDEARRETNDLRAGKARLKRSKSEFEALRRERDEARRENDDLRADKTKLERSKVELELSIQKSKMEKAGLESSLQVLRREKIELESSFQLLTREKAAFEVSLTQLESDKTDHKMRIENLVKNISALETCNRNLNKDKTELGALLKKLVGEKTQWDVSLETLEGARAEIEVTLQKLENEKIETNTSLQKLKQERAEMKASLQKLKKEKIDQDTYIKDLVSRNEALRLGKEQLEGLVEAKTAEIEALQNRPAPPLALAEGGLRGLGERSSCFHGLPDAMVPPLETMVSTVEVVGSPTRVLVTPISLAPAPSESAIFVKDEAWGPPPDSSPMLVPPPYTTSMELPALADAGDYYTEFKYNQLGFGVSSFLSNLLQMEFALEHPVEGGRLHSVVTEFIFTLGGLAITSNVAISRVEGFWQLCQPWASKPATSMTLRSSIEEQFVQLCFLIPHLKTPSQGRTWWATVQLINSLMKADHSAAPRAGMAFLATMTSTDLAVDLSNLDVKNVVLAIALCELCRFLGETFVDLPKPTWNVGNIFGPEVQAAAASSTMGKLGECLAMPDRSTTSTLREQLSNKCGDEFCFVPINKADETSRELGFLSCDNNEMFLMLDFVERSLRFVDRELAYSYFDGDRKKHLMIEKRDGEVLLDMTGVDRDVGVFWVRYAEHL